MKNDKQLINLDNLIMDKVLAYYDGPMLFVNKDKEENYYLVYCCDVDEKEYIIAKTSVSELIDVLKNAKTISFVFKNAIMKWKVKGDQSIECLEAFDEMDLLDDDVHLSDLGGSFDDYLAMLRYNHIYIDSVRKYSEGIMSSFVFNEEYNALVNSTILLESTKRVAIRNRAIKQWTFEREVKEDLCLT